MLNEAYKGLCMGCESLCCAGEKVKDRFMLRDMTRHINTYGDLSRKCSDIMRSLDITPEEPSTMRKLASKGSFMLNAVFDGSDAGVAEMIVKGIERENDSLMRVLHDCEGRGCHAEALSFCEDVIAFGKRAAGEMMDYT